VSSFRALAFLVAALLSAAPAQAQRLSDDLAPPGEEIEPTPAPETDAPEVDTPDPDGAIAIPDPPGGSSEVPDVRYPVPTPEETAAASADPSLRIPSRITTRLRSLDANLRALGNRGGGNVVNAVLSMLTGGLAITLGALKDNPTDWMSVYLYVYGGASAVRGVLDLVLTPNASGAAIAYQHMPMGTRDEIRARLAYGERELSSLAEQALIARVLDGSINIAAGAAVVPIYLAPNNFEISNPLDYFILIGAGVSIISGIITLASSSAEEQRWDAYRQLRDRLVREREEAAEHGEEDEPVALAPAPRWQLSASPTAGGAFGGFTLQF